MLNTVITIHTGSDTIRLTTQQKALSDWRSSGINATQYAGGTKKLAQGKPGRHAEGAD